MKQACVKGLYSCLRKRIRTERFTEVHDRYKNHKVLWMVQSVALMRGQRS